MSSDFIENNSFTDFEDQVSSLIDAWLILMREAKYREAEALCGKFVDNYSFTFKQRALNVEDSEYNGVLILLILVKGLHDYTQLRQPTIGHDWYKDNLTVEEVWLKLCDCKARLEFALCFCQSESIERVLQNLDGLNSFFQNTFRDSRYLSPGIVADKYLCGICNEDARACSHIKGRLYGGRICSYRPVNPRVNHVAIVKVPKDPRCRIWPWQIQDNDEGEGIKLEAIVLTSFSVDDFLKEVKR